MGTEGSKERGDEESARLSDGGFKKSPRQIMDSVEREREQKEQRENKRLSSRRKKIAAKLSITHGRNVSQERKFSPRSLEELSVATTGHRLATADVSEADVRGSDSVRSELLQKESPSCSNSGLVSPRRGELATISGHSEQSSGSQPAAWPTFEDIDSEESSSEETPAGGRWGLDVTSSGSSLDASAGQRSHEAAEEEMDVRETASSMEGSADGLIAREKQEAPEIVPSLSPASTAAEERKARDRARRKARMMLQSSRDVQQFYSQLGFDKVEVGQLHDVFKASAGGKDVLDFKSFNAALGRLETLGVQQMMDTPFAERLFGVFDSNGDQWVDKKEFLSGLGLLCKGTDEQKLSLTFSLYDVNDDGGISKEEIIEIFATTYEAKLRALAASNQPGVFKKMVDEEKLGMFVQQFRGVLASFVDSAFSKLDVDGNGLLDFEEFKAFAVSNPHVSAELNGLKKRVKMSLV